MANLLTNDDTIIVGDGWKAIGNSERVRNTFKLFNEGATELRLFVGRNAPTTELGVPVGATSNELIEHIEKDVNTYIKTTSVVAMAVSFIEG